MTGVVLLNPRTKFTDASGTPIAGGSVTVYRAGTTTLAATYQDKALTTFNTNPITLDANGECLLWVDSAYTYKILLKDAQGSTVAGYPVDNVPGAADVGAAASAAAVASQPYVADAEEARDAAIAAQGLAEDAAETAQLVVASQRFATKSAMDGSLAHAAGTFAMVYADSALANNGLYYKVGGSGSGSWEPYQGDRVVEAELLSKASTGDVYELGSPATYGSTTPNTSTYSAANDTLFPYLASAERGYLVDFSVRMSASGTGEIIVLVPDAHSQYGYAVAAVVAVSPASGVNTFVGSSIYAEALPAGTRVGYRGLTGGQPRYAAGDTVKRVVTQTQTEGDPLLGNILDYAQNVAVAFTIRPAVTESLDERVAAIEDGSNQFGSDLAAVLGQSVTAQSTTYGDAELTPSGNLTAGSNFIFSLGATPRAGVLESVTIPVSNPFAQAAGTVQAAKVLIASPNAAGAIEITHSYSIKLAVGEANTISGFGSLLLPAGSHVLIAEYTAFAPLQYKSGTTDGGGLLATKASPVVGDTITLGAYVNTPIFSYSLREAPEALGPQFTTTKGQVDLLYNTSNPVVLERTTFPGTSLPTGWVASGWTVDDGLTPPGSGGWGVKALCGTFSALWKRTQQWRITINSTDTITGICASPPENSGGAALLIDGSANELRLYSWEDTGAAGTLRAQVALPAALTAGRDYILELKKEGFTITGTFTDTVTQASCNLSYSTTSAYLMAHGKCGALFISATTPPEYQWCEYLAPYPRKCRALIIGDSITEGSYLGSGSPTWAQQVAGARSAHNDVVVAGRAGDETPNFLNRKAFDLDRWLPQFVVLALGTNDTSQDVWRVNMATLIARAEALGAEPILCTQVPRTAAQALRTAMNADIRDGYFGRYRYIDMAVAVSDSYDGVTWNAAYNSGDNIHPNAAGQNVMYAQALIDAPFLVR